MLTTAYTKNLTDPWLLVALAVWSLSDLAVADWIGSLADAFPEVTVFVMPFDEEGELGGWIEERLDGPSPYWVLQADSRFVLQSTRDWDDVVSWIEEQL